MDSMTASSAHAAPELKPNAQATTSNDKSRRVFQPRKRPAEIGKETGKARFLRDELLSKGVGEDRTFCQSKSRILELL